MSQLPGISPPVEGQHLFPEPEVEVGVNVRYETGTADLCASAPCSSTP